MIESVDDLSVSRSDAEVDRTATQSRLLYSYTGRNETQYNSIGLRGPAVATGLRAAADSAVTTPSGLSLIRRAVSSRRTPKLSFVPLAT